MRFDEEKQTVKFKQIQCASVPNVMSTQCNVFMYGLTADGTVFFKRDVDAKWQPVSMEWEPAR